MFFIFLHVSLCFFRVRQVIRLIHLQLVREISDGSATWLRPQSRTARPTRIARFTCIARLFRIARLIRGTRL